MWLSFTVFFSLNVIYTEQNGSKENSDLNDDKLIRILNYSTDIYQKFR